MVIKLKLFRVINHLFFELFIIDEFNYFYDNIII